MRTYELMYVVDPRVPEDEAIALSDSIKELVKTSGGTITKDEAWGRRKLAYPINKQNEGRYFLIYAHTLSDKGVNFGAVEHRLEQNDKVLRYLTVRTDGDIQRAKGKVTADLAAGIVPVVAVEEAPAPAPVVEE
ncbi:MAG: 30S ribosomal protein S6 [Thermoanaerobaculia bacterium]|nr:30S ribosomal protein S6 [Thermoanaerobaculia bacterium]